MNTSIIRYIVGYILKIEAALLLIPSIVAAIYREPEGLCYLSVSALCIFLGVLLSFRKPKNHVFYLKEGCVATSLSWIVLSFFGSIPTARFSGAVSHTGLAAWVFWSFCLLSFH